VQNAKPKFRQRRCEVHRSRPLARHVVITPGQWQFVNRQLEMSVLQSLENAENK
jgi:hypothetical protein